MAAEAERGTPRSRGTGAPGRRDAFDELVRTSIGRLDGAATLILRDRERARDAVQEALAGIELFTEAPAWAPDSERIAVSVLDASGATPHAVIWVVERDGSHQALRLPDLAEAFAPAWSPTGDRIAFLGSPWSSLDAFLYTSRVDGSDLVQVSQRPSNAAAGYLQLPRWSPDGARIAVHHGYPGALDRDVVVMQADGRRETVVGETDHDEAQPAWSPDGRHLAFWRNTSGFRWRVVIVDLANAGEEVVLAPIADTADSLAWSPEGTGITAIQCASDTTCELWLLDARDPAAVPTVLARVVPKSYDEFTDRAHWSWQRLAP